MEKTFSNARLDTQKKYAVRSSANAEDHKEHSFAGQFSTYLNVSYSDLQAKTQKVIDSTESPTVQAYKKALFKSFNIKMAIVIQEMVDVAKAGVVFGKDLQTNDRDNIIIDAVAGLGEAVVDGTEKTQKIVYSRFKDRYTKRSGDLQVCPEPHARTDHDLPAGAGFTGHLPQAKQSITSITLLFHNSCIGPPRGGLSFAPLPPMGA